MVGNIIPYIAGEEAKSEKEPLKVFGHVDDATGQIVPFEGPLPQTKYVLRKALEQKLKPIVVINKIDKPNQRVDDVYDEVLELFMELDADDDQLDFPVIYATARDGIAKYKMEDENDNLEPLMETTFWFVRALPRLMRPMATRPT